MRISSRIKLISTFGLLLTVVASLTLFGVTRGISHASGTLPQPSVRTGVTSVTTTASCGSWQAVPVPHNSEGSQLNGVIALSPKNVWAVGVNIEHWDGTSWSKVGSSEDGLSPGLSGVAALSANNIWAVGNSIHGGSGDEALIEHWNGTRWNLVPSPILESIDGVYSGLNALTAISSNNIWAVGFNDKATLIEHWNGIQWSIVPSPKGQGSLYAVTAISANNIWAIGSTANYQGGIALIEHWNGIQWSIVSNPHPSAFGDSLNGVTAISANNVWAVGEVYTSQVDNEALIEHWNGTRWSIVPSANLGSVDSSLNALTAISYNNIWAVGFDSSNGTLTEHWNGRSWNVVRSASRQGGALYAVAWVPRTGELWTVGLYWPYTSDYSYMFTEFYC